MVDANIFMDVVEDRRGAVASALVINKVAINAVRGGISALTIPILWFLQQNWKSAEDAKIDTKNITKGFSIVPLDNVILAKAFESDQEDFEDSIQLHSALHTKCDILITRNKKDYPPDKRIKILTPEEFHSSSN